MSEATVDTHQAGHESEGHAHPSDRQYVKIAAILAAITMLEVLTYFVDLGDLLVPSLMIMMVIKFFMVAAWFMHLRFDNRILTTALVTGLTLATTVYLIALSAFRFWDSFDF